MAIVYRHLKPNGEVFYIGIGKEDKRAYTKQGRNKYWKKVFNKYGYEVDILKRGLTWEEACELETILISWYGRKDLNEGTLTNLTNGGDGQKNPSEEHRQKLREAKLGKKESKEHRTKKRESYLKYKETLPDTYICTDTLKTFKTIKDCAKYLNIKYGTLKSYLGKSNKRKNTTTIVLYEDYLNGNFKDPHVARKHIKVMNTKTGDIYSSIKEAEIENGMPEDYLRRKLRVNKVNNTDFIIIS